MTIPQRLVDDGALALIRGFARLVFALLGYGYLSVQLGSTTGNGLMLALVFLLAYLVVHVVLLWRGRWIAEMGGLGLDLLAVTVLVILDPAATPPTLLLFTVVTLSAGLLRGLGRFMLSCAASLAIVGGLFAMGKFSPESSSAVLFLLILMAAMAIYSGMLMYRASVLVRRAREATWRDPETGLVSREAMVATSGWLLPLHDRLGASLTLVALSPAHPGGLQSLTDNLARRLRRSDVAARYHDDTIAVCLPCTTQTAAENLLTDLRQQGNQFNAAILSVGNAEHALDRLLGQLYSHLQRAEEDDNQWLVHAPVPTSERG
ncbi:MAG: GGDEF domain-containing protein [Alcanivoracaceae bacterium]|jgi:hypothetical protein|nr:GGDEF domain-containing protein [Alcanivoracaceae bacterium]